MHLSNEVSLQDPVFVQELSTSTLSRFLIENEGKRCVVVLDVRSQRSATCPKKPEEICSLMNLQEIEKVAEAKVLYSLLMPWELGKSVAGSNTPFPNVDGFRTLLASGRTSSDRCPPSNLAWHVEYRP